MRKEPLVKLERPPLIFSLAQVRFSPVLKIADYIPDIQDVLRKGDFPRFQQQQIQQLVFAPKVEVTQDFRWVFSSTDQHEAVLLTKDFVVYETNRYDVFETFVKKLEFVLSLVKEKVDVLMAERIGLRVVDLIRPAAGKAAVEFLQQPLRGLSAESFGAVSLLTHFLLQAKSAVGDFSIRSMGTEDGTFLPPDLVSTELVFDSPPAKGEQVIILDFDHVAPVNDAFDTKTLISKIWELHDITERAFKTAVTPEAINYWKVKRDQP